MSSQLDLNYWLKYLCRYALWKHSTKKLVTTRNEKTLRSIISINGGPRAYFERQPLLGVHACGLGGPRRGRACGWGGAGRKQMLSFTIWCFRAQGFRLVTRASAFEMLKNMLSKNSMPSRWPWCLLYLAISLHIILYYIVLYYIILYYIILHYVILYYTISYHIISYYIIICHIILCYVILCHIIWYYTICMYVLSCTIV